MERKTTPSMPKFTLEAALLVGFGAFLGANARYAIGLWAAERFGLAFPWATLIVNVTGSLALAVFAGWFTRHIGLSSGLRLFFAVGFCGAYTTFSTYALDTVTLAQTGEGMASAINVVVQNALCLTAGTVGIWLGSLI